MLAHMPRIFLAVTSAGIAVLITALILMVLRLEERHRQIASRATDQAFLIRVKKQIAELERKLRAIDE
jgi:hypothetical protein